MNRRLFVILVIVVTAFPPILRAADQAGPNALDDTKAHWLFEFSIASDKRLGTAEDFHAIEASSWAEGRFVFRGATVRNTTIRWVSPLVAIVKVHFVASDEALLLVMQKQGTDWHITHQYRLQKRQSPGVHLEGG